MARLQALSLSYLYIFCTIERMQSLPYELMRKLFYFARKEYESSLQTCCSSHFLHRMEPRAATQKLFVSCWTLTCFVMYFLSVWLASPTIVSQTVSSTCHEGLSGTGSKRNRGVGSMRCGVDCCSRFVRTDLISTALPFHDKLAGPDVLST